MDCEVIDCTFAIVGGGIAGVSCAEGISFLAAEESVVLITASPLIKAVTNVMALGKTVMQFDVEERNAESLVQQNASLKIIHDIVTRVNVSTQSVETQQGKLIRYKKLCLCNGAKPKLIAENKFVVGIRDTESAAQFAQKVQHAKRMIVVGNGGIASELIHEVENIEIIWVVKDNHITATFIDPGAAEFLLDDIKSDKSKDSTKDLKKNNGPLRRQKFMTVITQGGSIQGGPALGPDWHNNYDIKGISSKFRRVQIEYGCEVCRIFNEAEEYNDTETWPVYMELSNGKILGSDLIVSATGVIPNSNIPGLEDLKKAEDGGFLVDWKLETTSKDIYAAGDVCTAGWDLAKHWFQMRLWTQAHQMGLYVAKSITSSYKGEEFLQDFCFEIFTHVTKFFGYKVVLIGLFNGQKLGNNYEVLLRVTKKQEYVKLILENGRLQGAVLIGDTDLEEMCENLILNQLDLNPFGEDLLNPNIDIEDYFD